MSVVKFTFDGREGRDGIGAKRSYVWKYTAEVDSADDDENVVLAYEEVPALYAAHPTDRRALVKSRSATQESPWVWRIVVNLDTEPISEKDKQRDETENPLDRPVEIDWDYVDDVEMVEEDVDGDAIATANYERFDPGCERLTPISVLTLGKNQATFSASDQLTYGNTLNAEAFYGAAAGKAKMLPMRATRVVEGEYVYWRVTYTVHFRERGWQYKPLHQGFMVRTDDGIVKAEDEDGNESSVPVPLDAAGHQIDPEDDPHFLEFDVFETVSWTSLGLEAT